MYLAAIELKPDNRAVVHHMIAYLDPHGDSAKLDNKDAEPGLHRRRHDDRRAGTKSFYRAGRRATPLAGCRPARP
jgi:hypothetical protein